MIRVVILLLLTGCGSTQSTSPPVVSSGPAVSDDAPGWARKGDISSDTGHRFICEGQGRSEDEALGTARAICDDKICKLCGVEIESIVETTETLTGIEMQRKVVERCRRVRQGDSELQRKSVDCGPAGCVAWIQIDYSKQRRELECNRLTNENFADPEACQALIEEFKTVEGYTAASFRRRVSLLEDALAACAEIDVRPTPLMQSLGEKLSIGMGTFRKRAPGYLYKHWLADYPPMWEQYKQSPKFAERLQLLLGYLRSKVPILDVTEATYVDDERLDTPEAIAFLFAKMKAAPRAKAYGVGDIHMLAVSHLGTQARKKHLRQDLAAINTWVRKTYPPAPMIDWGHVSSMARLFAADGTIDAEEWAWASALSSRWRARIQYELFKTEKHTGKTRQARFMKALAAVRKDKPTQALDRTLRTLMPRQLPAFFLDIEPSLSKEMRDAIDWSFLAKQLPGTRDISPLKDQIRLLERMRQALRDNPISDGMCNSLYKWLDLLDAYGVSTTGLDDPICDCLEGPMRDVGTLTSGNKSPLYERAVMESFQCVRPQRSSS
ncbi:MAG: hypothetical protein V3T05_06845 [Myxococcota bacterium]